MAAVQWPEHLENKFDFILFSCNQLDHRPVGNIRTLRNLALPIPTERRMKIFPAGEEGRPFGWIAEP
jgi:hypothetical protein